MATTSRIRRLAPPIAVLIAGVCWLLGSTGLLPGVDWIWVGLLAAGGLWLLMTHGLTRIGIVCGGFLLVCAVAALVRSAGYLPVKYEIPGLVVALGLLWASAEALLPEEPGPLPEPSNKT